MRICSLTAFLLLAALPAFSAGKPAPECPAEVQTASGACATKKEIKRAHAAFARGLKHQAAHRTAQAFAEFEEAAGLLPHNLEYATAREIVRQQMVYEHLERGNTLLSQRQPLPALTEFHAAVQLDPSNAFAQQRLRDALGERAPLLPHALRLVASSEEIEFAPQPGRKDFHYRGDTRGLMNQVAAAFGVSVVFDDSVLSRPARFDVDEVDFYTAMQLAAMMSRAFYAPLSDKQVLVAADTADNHRQLDRMSVRTFYLPASATPQEINELVGVLRGLFDIRSISPSPGKGLLVLRAPKRLLDPATEFLESLGTGRSEVLLDVKVFEVSHTALRNLGIQLPLQFKMFNIPSLAALVATTPDLQNLINQLIASGGINQANSAGIAALLAQVQNQSLNPLLTTPFVTFGGGTTMFAVTIPPTVLNLSFNSSNFRSLEHMTLRASDGTPATFTVGRRFPILNASFSPIFNTPAVARAIQSKTFIAPFPSFTYENLGMTLKTTPQIHPSSDVTLQLEMKIEELTGQNANGIPLLSNREYKGGITLKHGETAVVVGSISQSQQVERTGLPGLGNLPVVRRAVTNEVRQQSENELLVVITPHIVATSGGTPDRAEIWLPPSR